MIVYDCIKTRASEKSAPQNRGERQSSPLSLAALPSNRTETQYMHLLSCSFARYHTRVHSWFARKGTWEYRRMVIFLDAVSFFEDLHENFDSLQDIFRSTRTRKAVYYRFYGACRGMIPTYILA